MTTLEISTIILTIISIIAIVGGPIAAVLIGQHLQDRKQRIDRRQQVYKDLMGTRRIILHIDHVKALNMIDVEFSSSNDEDTAIRGAWQLYVAHLGDDKYRKEDGVGWGRKTDSLLYDLLEKMSKAVGVSVQRAQIENGGYSPQFYNNIENEQQMVRHCIIDLICGHKSIKVYQTDDDPTPCTPKKNDVNEGD